MRAFWLIVRGIVFALLVWGVAVPRACGDTIIPAGTLCPAGHRYEPLRLVDPEPRWLGLCYTGKDAEAALARAGHVSVGPTLAKSIDKPEGPCVTCDRLDYFEDLLFDLWLIHELSEAR